MTNSSDAYGRVTITTQNKDNLKNFLYLQLTTNIGSFYETTLGCFDAYDLNDRTSLNKELDEEITSEDGLQSIYLEVTGSGYGEFKNNIREFFDAPLTFDYNNEELNEIKNRLQKEKFIATFDITDVQTHDHYIEEATYEVTFENLNSTLKTLSKQEYEYCAQNLMKIDYCDWAADRKSVLAYPEEYKAEFKYLSEYEQKLLSDWELVKLALDKMDDTVYTEFDEFTNDLVDYVIGIKRVKNKCN